MTDRLFLKPPSPAVVIERDYRIPLSMWVCLYMLTSVHSLASYSDQWSSVLPDVASIAATFAARVPGPESDPKPAPEPNPSPEPELEAAPEPERSPATEPELEAAPEPERSPAPEPGLELARTQSRAAYARRCPGGTSAASSPPACRTASGLAAGGGADGAQLACACQRQGGRVGAAGTREARGLTLFMAAVGMPDEFPPQELYELLAAGDCLSCTMVLRCSKIFVKTMRGEEMYHPYHIDTAEVSKLSRAIRIILAFEFQNAFPLAPTLTHIMEKVEHCRKKESEDLASKERDEEELALLNLISKCVEDHKNYAYCLLRGLHC
ncbi:hypothetical protein EJB05_23960, partial [Eragrostis curvula]